MSDIDTAVVDSLKVLDPNWPIREATELRTSLEVRFVPEADITAITAIRKKMLPCEAK